MARTLEERIKRIGEGWAYKQLVKAYEQMGRDSTPENLKVLNQTYQRVNRLFFDQLSFDADLKKEQFFSGEIKISSISEAKAFAQKNLEKALALAYKYMPVYTKIYHVIAQRKLEQ